MIFPVSNSKYKILKCIYENPGIKISEILKKTKTSQKEGYKNINEFLKIKVIEEKLEGEKPTLRLFSPHFSEAGRLIFSLIEEEKKLEFFERYKELKGAFEHFQNEAKEIADCAIIFGSFARYSAEKTSDIDMLVLTKKSYRKKLDKISETCFVTLKNRVELRIIETEDFIRLLKKRDNFALQILKEHVIIINPQMWIDILIKKDS
jgi:predicted nucleotidyltransferase